MTNLYFFHLHACYSIFQNLFCAGIQFFVVLNSYTISLKNNPFIKEDTIQKFIFDNPSVLGLGDLSPVQREKIQPSGGRLDLLLADDNGTRFEVEIQLGATDPSHIIRTIEYWDTERKRYPQYDHCAVIVAEEIAGRFMNVISLFNGAIPLIALRLSAFQQGEDISLVFTKVLDRINIEAEDVIPEATDRNYWEKKSTPKMLKVVDSIFTDLRDIIGDYNLNYNKYYIGMIKDGLSKNFITFRPKKKYVYIDFKSLESSDRQKSFEDAGIDFDFNARYNSCRIRINDFNEYKQNKELIDECVKNSFDYFNNN